MDIHRYLADFDLEKVDTEHHDVIVIGSGIAGVYTALEIPAEYGVVILTKESIDISNSVLAQGGIAVSLDEGDSPELHFRDTIYAGAGLCDEKSVWVLVNEAAKNIDCLCKSGVNFDREKPDELSLSREAAHSKNRIIHAGDTTGKEVCDTLISIVRTRDNVEIRERIFALDLLTDGNACKGILAYDENVSAFKAFLSDVVICATGGFGQLYEHTTNPEVATGDGAGMAYRAGAELMDMEFIQFHPTVLHHPDNKSFLISEALRGEGALLKNIRLERFMPLYHELGELAPRDIVTRAIFEEMKKTKAEHVYLDITFKSKKYLENRFPNIYKTCLNYGIDIAKDFIPVAPAEHYCMGGIKTDINGRTSIEGFFACGEAACNGIHGANRLASNSLLEGLVFGHRIGNQIKNIIEKQNTWGRFSCITHPPFPEIHENRPHVFLDREAIKKDIQKVMTENVGIIRNRRGLEKALEQLTRYYEMLKGMKNESINDYELQNMALLSILVTESALEREESRGAHFRSDFNKTDNVKWRKNIIKKGDAEHVEQI